jgi:chromosome segregation ATPase
MHPEPVVADPLAEMRSERDRFAFDNARLQKVISHLKEQVRGEQQAKERVQKELEVIREAWASTQSTKDTLAEMALLGRDEAEALVQALVRKEHLEASLQVAEQHLRNLIARLDRDGGHKQATDASLQASVERADLEVVRLLARDHECGPKTKSDLLRIVRAFLDTLTDEGREEFFYEVENGYCGSCGRKLRSDHDFCQCTNDE